MAPLSDLMRAAAEASRPSPETLDRARRRIARSVRGDRDAAALLRGVGEPEPAVVDRLRDRLLVPRRGRRGGPVLAAAAAVLLAAGAWWSSPSPTPASTASDDTLALELEAEDPHELAATEDVDLRFAGRGRATGSKRAPRIAWQRGRIELEVTPGQGVDLVVATPEAEVAVVGTVFDVERDGLGTAVHVTRGHVAVRCTSGEAHDLLAGDRATCAPTDAAGLLGRARTLRARGASLDDVLGALDRALAAGGEAVVRGEVLATRTRVLLDAGRTDDALATARRYLDEGHAPRREELRALVEAWTTEAPSQPEVSP